MLGQSKSREANILTIGLKSKLLNERLVSNIHVHFDWQVNE